MEKGFCDFFWIPRRTMLVGLLGPSFVGKRTVAELLRVEESFDVYESYDNVVANEGLMKCWQGGSRVVIRSVNTAGVAEILAKRPFSMLVCVDAPLMVRFERSRVTDMAQFLRESDEMLYGDQGIGMWMRKTSVRIVNRSTMEDLRKAVIACEFGNEEHIRPGWDSYFIGIADLLAERTNCMLRQAAAVIVKDTRVVSTGYTGTPRR